MDAQDYTHSTAPNRRFADTVTQRLIKSIRSSQPQLYSDKRIPAVALQHRIGETFGAVVTRVTPKGVFIRVSSPPAEGLLVRGQQGVDVGDQLQVKLLSTDPQRGYLDFAR